MTPPATGNLVGRSTPWLITLIVITATAAVGWLFVRPAPPMPQPTAVAEPAPAKGTQADPTLINFPENLWKATALAIEPAAAGLIEQATSLTGVIGLNEDRLAHVYPLVDGRVDSVHVSLGDRVQKGQQMAVIQSRQVGDAMLRLAQDRLQLGFAKRKDEWTQAISANTLTMIGLLRARAPVEEIEKQLQNQPLGEYRDKLMTAYIDQATARKNLDRLEPLQSEGIVASRHIYEAEASWKSNRATLQSLLEQLEQEARQAAVMSTQQVAELETRVAVDEAALKILGLDATAIAEIDPRAGAALARCPILAPFDGTVISKDVVLLEHVGPTNQILSIADLSSVWLSADVYEEQLPLLENLQNKVVQFRSGSWPGETFEATVFYTGDLVDDESRTLHLRAVAQNPKGRLKPGMFVSVELPDTQAATVLQVPLAAVLEHDGVPFVFQHLGGERFRRQNVELGRRTATAVEIRSGLTAGDPIVISGGFALKSRMLSALLEE